jgi:hypothetical protein
MKMHQRLNKRIVVAAAILASVGGGAIYGVEQDNQDNQPHNGLTIDHGSGFVHSNQEHQLHNP